MNNLAHHSTTPTKIQTQVDYILLDGSGSMITSWYDTLDSVQAYVDGVKAQNIKSHCIMQVFDDTNLDMVGRDCDIDAWVPLRQQPVGSTFGGTPLYDAINVMGRKLRDMDPPRCSIVIVTDGGESDSRFTDRTQAKSILDWCRAKGWQVTFIGAEFDNSAQARALGAGPNAYIGVSKKMLTSAIDALAKKRARYGLYGESMEYTDDEKQQFGGYLSGPSK
jgi:hypothetical protein